jgi:methionyl-tRNA formyltransferase
VTARARTVFLGSGSFAVPIAEGVARSATVELVGVFSVPPRPAGRGAHVTPTPVAEWSAARSLPLLTPARLRDADALASLAALRPELLVLADYGRLVPADWLAVPMHGALNVHPSLLPRHRGASPIAATISAGDVETGVSVLLMDAGIDSGPIVAQRRVPLRGDEEAPELEAHLAGVGAELLEAVLPEWVAGSLQPRPQPVEGVTVTRPLRRADGRLDPHRPAVELERQVRALKPWPGTFLELPDLRLAVLRAAAIDRPAVGHAAVDPPGTLVEAGEGLGLATADGVLVLEEVQPAGGRPMSGAALRRGRRNLLGLHLPDRAAGEAD